jgi:hypothetical protein
MRIEAVESFAHLGEGKGGFAKMGLAKCAFPRAQKAAQRGVREKSGCARQIPV